MLAVRFYPSGGDGPVRRCLEALRADPGRKDAWAKITKDLAVMEAEGLRSREITVKRVAGVKGSVWELVRPYQGTAYRVYFCIRRGEAWLLHWLEKKSRRIPRPDVELIGRRAKEVFGR